MANEFFKELGKEAAKRITSKTRTVKGKKNIRKALHEEPKDARQLPWSYGEKRKKPSGPKHT